MKKALLLTALGLLSVLLLIGCSNQATYTGNGATLEKAFAYRDFSTIEISGTVEYHIAHEDNYSVVASLPENLSNNLKISQSSQKLTIALKKGEYVNAKYRVNITMPVLDQLMVSGTTVGNVAGFNSSSEFALKMDGTNVCSLIGSARHATLQILGAGLANAADFQTQTADVSLSGCSSATVNNQGILNARIKDISTLNYIGDPTLADIRVQDSSSIKRQ